MGSIDVDHRPLDLAAIGALTLTVSPDWRLNSSLRACARTIHMKGISDLGAHDIFYCDPL